ncbi:TfoX/Sxy family protein [Terrarubrum flagellatum]|uniref:TfoX/Sxy family protein n=1 Tax=Terrirubrum flagellatum TaxID=2895980 RepID=UPI00314557F9
MAWRKPDPELSALFGAAIPTDPRVERRTMFGCPAALVNGALFGCVHQESFVLKFSEQDRARLRDEFDAHGYEFTSGRGIRDFVAMPDEILDDRRLLGEWIARSIDYVATKKSAKAPKRVAKKVTKKPPAKRKAAKKVSATRN